MTKAPPKGPLLMPYRWGSGFQHVNLGIYVQTLLTLPLPTQLFPPRCEHARLFCLTVFLSITSLHEHSFGMISSYTCYNLSPSKSEIESGIEVIFTIWVHSFCLVNTKGFMTPVNHFRVCKKSLIHAGHFYSIHLVRLKRNAFLYLIQHSQ